MTGKLAFQTWGTSLPKLSKIYCWATLGSYGSEGKVQDQIIVIKLKQGYVLWVLMEENDSAYFS